MAPRRKAKFYKRGQLIPRPDPFADADLAARARLAALPPMTDADFGLLRTDAGNLPPPHPPSPTTTAATPPTPDSETIAPKPLPSEADRIAAAVASVPKTPFWIGDHRRWSVSSRGAYVTIWERRVGGGLAMATLPNGKTPWGE